MGSCPPQPTPGKRFGHSIAIADVDGDSIGDLVVGASDTTELDLTTCTRTQHGRVYVFFGHANFLAEHYPGPTDPPGYLFRCLAIKAPQMSPGISGPRFVPNGLFGLSVDAADLDGDSKAEIVAGRCERDLDRGRAHIFNGAWLASHLLPTQPSSYQFPVLVTPLAIDKNIGTSGQFETLVDTTDDDTARTAFGLNVFMLRKDVGSSYQMAFDDRPDVAVYSDKATYYADIDEPEAGALWIFFNDSNGFAPNSLVSELAGLKIQTPENVDVPREDSRFGFVAATINWATTQGGTATCLLVGEPGAVVQSKASAGRFYMFSTPLDGLADPGTLHSAFSNTEPGGSQANSFFGCWTAVGNYTNDANHPGDEFIVPAYGRDVTVGSNTFPSAGRIYAYRSAP